MASSDALVNRVITLTQRVPPATVVDRPPTARSLGVVLEPKFHVPFLALLASEMPPSYINVVCAAA